MEPLQKSGSAFSMLVAEDDKAAREALCLMIRKKFPDVTIYPAENGSVGLEIFNRHRPEVVVTDVNMPVMDGIRMSELIKEIQAETKFIVLTAYNEKIFFEKFSVIGFCAYILKPIEFRKLFAAIEKCIAEFEPKRQ